MPISPDRLRKDFEAIAGCTATPGHGATRPTFSPAWAAARTYVITQAEAAGCSVRTDAAGNVHARPAVLGWETPAWLVGSHIDSVPNGGDYDGVAGVVVGLELLRSAQEDGFNALSVELIVFAEEEGPTFGLGMLGSRAWVGDLSAERLGELKNSDGKSYLEAGVPFGVVPDKIVTDRIDPKRYRGLIEVHIEQGPAMWAEDIRLAVVTAIAGRMQYQATMTGVPNHAGSTPMHYRKDPLVAAARVIVEIDRLARESDPTTVATVGRIECGPNAVNVIPGIVRFTVDVRSPHASKFAEFDNALSQSMIASRAGDFALQSTENQPPIQMNTRLCAALRSAAGSSVPDAVSGALHDSAILAPHVPTAMLFVPSRDGISHNPAEFSRVEDIAAAAGVVERVVRRPTVDTLNFATQEAFVAAVGHVFEHSPWVAERTWETGRPFGSISDLHGKMSRTVRAVTPDEQVKLIQAHPDLVGKLAREGRLTAASTNEQAAAGLTALSAAEADAFTRYNATYRERFGFPFVICARENKKDAILAAFPVRLKNSTEAEIATALEEIDKIARLRLADALWEG